MDGNRQNADLLQAVLATNQILSRLVQATGSLRTLPSYTVAQAQNLTAGVGTMIYVTDETGGAVGAIFDGSDWRRTTDRAVIS